MASQGTRAKNAAPARTPLTHFLCIPLVNSQSRPQFDRSLARFRAMVTGEDVSPSIDPKSIRPPGTLHFTLGVMSLNDQQLAEATDLLRSLDLKTVLSQATGRKDEFESSVSGTTSSSGDALTISLKGLKSMHAPQQTSVLYTSPDGASGRIYGFCLALKERFSHFMIADHRELTLHATIVNTIYAKGRKQGGRQGTSKAKTKIDARGLLALFDGWTFAEDIRLDRIAICEMGAKKLLDAEGKVVNEEYLEVATVSLPN